MKRITDIVQYPFDAQSSPFFCALASTLLPVLGYTEETPFFCGAKDTYCVNCGNCGNKTTLQKHHLQLYHDYQTFTGVSLGWEWPEYDSEYQVIPCWKPNWRWPDEFLNFIFGFAGLSWMRLQKSMGKKDIFTMAKASIEMGFPVLMRLGMDWHVITGYDEEMGFWGIGYNFGEPVPLSGWFQSFEDAIIITGHTDKSVTTSDILARMIQTLAHPANAKLEADLMARLDGVSSGNAWETAEWLLEKVGFPIEARWHAADSSLLTLCANTAGKDKIFGMIKQYVFDGELDATHGTCWKIWAQLGVGPNTNYALPENAGEILLKPETQDELKRLFSIVFANDRTVLELLHEAAEYIK